MGVGRWDEAGRAEWGLTARVLAEQGVEVYSGLASCLWGRFGMFWIVELGRVEGDCLTAWVYLARSGSSSHPLTPCCAGPTLLSRENSKLGAPRKSKCHLSSSKISQQGGLHALSTWV